MTHKDWSQYVLFTITLCLTLIIILNYFVDPFGIFMHNPNNTFQPNERFIKIAFLEKKIKIFKAIC